MLPNFSSIRTKTNTRQNHKNTEFTFTSAHLTCLLWCLWSFHLWSYSFSFSLSLSDATEAGGNGSGSAAPISEELDIFGPMVSNPLPSHNITQEAQVTHTHAHRLSSSAYHHGQLQQMESVETSTMQTNTLWASHQSETALTSPQRTHGGQRRTYLLLTARPDLT